MKKILTKVIAMGVATMPIGMVLSCNDSGSGGTYLHLVTSGSPIEDKSFNQQSRDAIRDYGKKHNKKWGASKANSENAADLKTTYQAVLDGGAKILVTTGFGVEETVEKFATDNPDKKFIHVDGKTVSKNNLISITYKTEHASFLAGIATGLMLNLNWDRFKTDGLKVGAWGGNDSPPISAFIGGFQQGIAYFNQHLAFDKDHMVEFVLPGSDRDSMYSGTWDVGGSTGIPQKLFQDKKADVVMGVAGAQSQDAIKFIKEKNLKSLMIGVDVDQTTTLGEDGKYIFTSVMKNVYGTVMKALQVFDQGKTIPGFTPGQNSNEGIDKDFVKLAEGAIKSTAVDKKINEIISYFPAWDALKSKQLFKDNVIEEWKTATTPNIYNIVHLPKYKTESKKAEPFMWSQFKGIISDNFQPFNLVEAKKNV